MQMSHRTLSAALAIAAACGGSIAADAHAQQYPTKIIRVVNPNQPGGNSDVLFRMLAPKMGEILGQQLVIDYRPGAGGNIGTEIVSKAAPDGYTTLIAAASFLINPSLIKNLPFDAVKDFTPVAMVGGTPNVLALNPSVPAKNLKEFVDYAKRNAGKLSYGSAGQGTLTHLAMEQFKVAADFDAVHAAYRGIGPAITDLLGGQTQMMMPGLAAAIPHIKAGKMTPIAVTGSKRHPLLPDVPTFEELGYKGFDGVQWYGIVGPANMPVEITGQLNAGINKALADPQLQARLAGEALEPMPMTPGQFGKFIENDIARWSKLAKERNIKLEE